MMNEDNTLHADLFTRWKSISLNEARIKEELSLKGYSEVQIHEIITRYQALRHKERLSKGFILIVTGSVLDFISCILTVMDVFPAARDFFIYGLTSLSVIIAMTGCYLVLEKP